MGYLALRLRRARDCRQRNAVECLMSPEEIWVRP
jgi:hypothetical protein